MVHTCIRADEAVMRFDDENAVGADDAARFAKDHLDKTRVARKFPRQGHSLGGRPDRGQPPDAPFRFRNDFLSDDQNISAFKRDFRTLSGEGGEFGQIVALANFRETGQHEERNR